MRLTLHTSLTLDGVMQAPGGPDEDRDAGFEHGGWSFPYGDEDFAATMAGWFARADAFLLGRKTYGQHPRGLAGVPATTVAHTRRPGQDGIDNAEPRRSATIEGTSSRRGTSLDALEHERPKLAERREPPVWPTRPRDGYLAGELRGLRS